MKRWNLPEDDGAYAAFDTLVDDACININYLYEKPWDGT